MTRFSILSAAALSLVAAGCGQGPATTPTNGQTAASTGAAPSDRSYSASGQITAIAGDRVTISHGPVEGLGWPAMTMTFKAGDPAMLQGIRVGDRVSFQFRQDGTDYPLTAINKTP